VVSVRHEISSACFESRFGHYGRRTRAPVVRRETASCQERVACRTDELVHVHVSQPCEPFLTRQPHRMFPIQALPRHHRTVVACTNTSDKLRYGMGRCTSCAPSGIAWDCSGACHTHESPELPPTNLLSPLGLQSCIPKNHRHVLWVSSSHGRRGLGRMNRSHPECVQGQSWASASSSGQST
jgi:hypothetical protein